MARKKRKSKAVESGLKRAAALTAIDPKLDLGNGLTLDAYNASIQAHEDNVDSYNTDLSGLDTQLTDIKANEKKLDQLSVRMLKGVLEIWRGQRRIREGRRQTHQRAQTSGAPEQD